MRAKPEPDSSVGVRAVQRAVLDLHRNRDTWPTIADVAGYLQIKDRDAGRLLLDLRRSRVMIDRVRQGKRVWMPWREGQR